MSYMRLKSSPKFILKVGVTKSGLNREMMENRF